MPVTQEQKYLIFPYILIFLEMLVFLSTDMYLPALPLMVKEFNITQDMAQYTQTTWFLGSMSMQLFLGPLSEQYGRKCIIMIGIVIFIVSSFICATTSEINIFLTARFLQGTTVCAVLVAGYATIHDLYTGKKVVQILAIISSITILAPALGPFCGALIIKYNYWRSIFGLLTALAVIGLLGVYMYMPENHRLISDNKKFIKKAMEDYTAIFKNSVFMRFALIESFVIICFFIWITESPFIIITAYGKSEMYFGIAQLFVFSGFICGSQTTKFLVHKVHAKTLCDYGLGVVGMAVILFVVFSSLKLNIMLIILSMMGVAYGASMSSGLLNRLAIESSTQPMAHRVAVFSSFISLGAIVGSYSVTLINDMSFDNIAYLMLGYVFVAFTVYGTMRKKINLSH